MGNADAGRIERALLVSLVPNAASTSARVEDFRAALAPEARLLLDCACLHLSSAARDRIVCLVRLDLDWSYLMNLAARHRLLPLLYRHLNALAAAAVPKMFFMELWGRHERNSRRNQTMAKELTNILRTFEANGITAIAYKGPALAESVYDDLALREFLDLDILLRRQDVLSAKNLLLKEGYEPEFDLDPSVEQAFLLSCKEYHVVVSHPARDVMVELHWKTDAYFPVEKAGDEQWWANLGYARFGEDRIRCFANEELLLILCIHGSRHAWESLGWLVDVAELIRQHPDLLWNKIIGEAAQLECQRSLALGLTLTDRLLYAPVPGDVRMWMEGVTGVDKPAEKILGALFHSAPAPMALSEAWRYEIGLFERPRQKLFYCMNVALTPTWIEWLRWPLPRPLFFLYWPLRLFRLLAKYGMRGVNGR